MNELSPWQRERILERLREGRSLRSIEAETGHRRETISRYGRDAGLLQRRSGTVKGEPSACLRLCGPSRRRSRIFERCA